MNVTSQASPVTYSCPPILAADFEQKRPCLYEERAGDYLTVQLREEKIFDEFDQIVDDITKKQLKGLNLKQKQELFKTLLTCLTIVDQDNIAYAKTDRASLFLGIKAALQKAEPSCTFSVMQKGSTCQKILTADRLNYVKKVMESFKQGSSRLIDERLLKKAVIAKKSTKSDIDWAVYSLYQDKGLEASARYLSENSSKNVDEVLSNGFQNKCHADPWKPPNRKKIIPDSNSFELISIKSISDTNVEKNDDVLFSSQENLKIPFLFSLDNLNFCIDECLNTIAELNERKEIRGLPWAKKYEKICEILFPPFNKHMKIIPSSFSGAPHEAFFSILTKRITAPNIDKQGGKGWAEYLLITLKDYTSNDQKVRARAFSSLVSQLAFATKEAIQNEVIGCINFVQSNHAINHPHIIFALTLLACDSILEDAPAEIQDKIAHELLTVMQEKYKDVMSVEKEENYLHKVFKAHYVDKISIREVLACTRIRLLYTASLVSNPLGARGTLHENMDILQLSIPFFKSYFTLPFSYPSEKDFELFNHLLSDRQRSRLIEPLLERTPQRIFKHVSEKSQLEKYNTKIKYDWNKLKKLLENNVPSTPLQFIWHCKSLYALYIATVGDEVAKKLLISIFTGYEKYPHLKKDMIKVLGQFLESYFAQISHHEKEWDVQYTELLRSTGMPLLWEVADEIVKERNPVPETSAEEINVSIAHNSQHQSRILESDLQAIFEVVEVILLREFTSAEVIVNPKLAEDEYTSDCTSSYGESTGSDLSPLLSPREGCVLDEVCAALTIKEYDKIIELISSDKFSHLSQKKRRQFFIEKIKDKSIPSEQRLKMFTSYFLKHKGSLSNFKRGLTEGLQTISKENLKTDSLLLELLAIFTNSKVQAEVNDLDFVISGLCTISKVMFFSENPEIHKELWLCVSSLFELSFNVMTCSDESKTLVVSTWIELIKLTKAKNLESLHKAISYGSNYYKAMVLFLEHSLNSELAFRLSEQMMTSNPSSSHEAISMLEQVIAVSKHSPRKFSNSWQTLGKALLDTSPEAAIKAYSNGLSEGEELEANELEKIQATVRKLALEVDLSVDMLAAIIAVFINTNMKCKKTWEHIFLFVRRLKQKASSLPTLWNLYLHAEKIGVLIDYPDQRAVYMSYGLETLRDFYTLERLAISVAVSIDMEELNVLKKRSNKKEIIDIPSILASAVVQKKILVLAHLIINYAKLLKKSKKKVKDPALIIESLNNQLEKHVAEYFAANQSGLSTQKILRVFSDPLSDTKKITEFASLSRVMQLDQKVTAKLIQVLKKFPSKKTHDLAKIIHEKNIAYIWIKFLMEQASFDDFLRGCTEYLKIVNIIGQTPAVIHMLNAILDKINNNESDARVLARFLSIILRDFVIGDFLVIKTAPLVEKIMDFYVDVKQIETKDMYMRELLSTFGRRCVDSVTLLKKTAVTKLFINEYRKVYLLFFSEKEASEFEIIWDNPILPKNLCTLQ